MPTPRNLTAARGPSVWDRAPREAPWPLIALAASTLFATAWFFTAANRRASTFAAFAAGLSASLATSPGRRALRTVWGRLVRWRTTTDPTLDQAVEGTFPASDPVALSYGTKT